MSRVLTALVLALMLALAGCGGDDGASEDSAAGAGDEAAQPASGQCESPEQPPPRDDGGQTKPKRLLDPKKTYEIVFETSCGEFTIRLDQKRSPEASASVAALVRNGFYDDTIFHRIVPGFVIQAGDPTVTGDGDPGYSTRDKVPRNATYEPGTVAMGKGGTDPPGHAGSQFFIVTGDGSSLTPDYALLGRVTKGMDVVQAIGELGDPATGTEGTPLQSVVIEKATVRER